VLSCTFGRASRPEVCKVGAICAAANRSLVSAISQSKNVEPKKESENE